MNYRGYTARYEFDHHDRVLHGRIVDDSLEFCARDGVEPNRPYAESRRAAS